MSEIKYYIINDQIEFWPKENKLINTNHDASTTLSGPASRCFLVMLQKKSSIVSQKELFQQVWGDDGKEVPTNTLYQNISLIRRGIASVCHESGNFIETVPRTGFKIKKDVSIVEITEEESSHSISSNIKTNVSSPLKINLTLPVIMFTIFICLLVAYFNINTTAFFIQYHPVNFEGYSCNIYQNNNSPLESEKRDVIKKHLTCERYPWVYLTSYYQIPVISAIMCANPISQATTDCASIFIQMEEKNEISH